jgi:hypothetical protein
MARLRIEVVYAKRDRQEVVLVELDEGARAIDAIRESRLGLLHPEIDAVNPSTGIFGRRVAPETSLRDGDRVEIYRPLLIDPKAARRAKAKKGGTR